MANSTSANLKLTVQTTGENSGTWGQITNTNLLILEQAIGGYDAVGLNATTGATLSAVGNTGVMIYVSNGAAGNPGYAFSNGTTWKQMAAPTTDIATS